MLAERMSGWLGTFIRDGKHALPITTRQQHASHTRLQDPGCQRAHLALSCEWGGACAVISWVCGQVCGKRCD